MDAIFIPKMEIDVNAFFMGDIGELIIGIQNKMFKRSSSHDRDHRFLIVDIDIRMVFIHVL